MCPIALLREPKGGETPDGFILDHDKHETNATQDITVPLAASLSPILTIFYLGCKK